MTADQHRALQALKHCQFGMNSRARHFALELARKPVEYGLTDRQQAYLWRLCQTYRRQLPRDLVSLAEDALVDLSREGSPNLGGGGAPQNSLAPTGAEKGGRGENQSQSAGVAPDGPPATNQLALEIEEAVRL